MRGTPGVMANVVSALDMEGIRCFFKVQTLI